jgi:hypothetical protein
MKGSVFGVRNRPGVGKEVGRERDGDRGKGAMCELFYDRCVLHPQICM